MKGRPPLPIYQAPRDQDLCSADQGRLGGLGWWGPFLALLGNPHLLLVSPPIEEQRAHKLTGFLRAGTVCAASILCHQSSVALAPQSTRLLLHCPGGSQTRVSRVWVLLGSWALSIPQLPLPYQEQPRTGCASWASRVLGQGQQGMFRGRWAKARSSGQQGGDREHPGSMLCGLWRPPRPPLTPGRLQRPCGDGRGECQHLPAYKALCLLHPSCHTHPSVCLCGTVRGVRLTCTQANLQVRPQAHVPEQAGWPSPPLHPPAAGSKGKVGVKRLLTEGETEAQEGHGPDTA